MSHAVYQHQKKNITQLIQAENNDDLVETQGTKRKLLKSDNTSTTLQKVKHICRPKDYESDCLDNECLVPESQDLVADLWPEEADANINLIKPALNVPVWSVPLDLCSIEHTDVALKLHKMNTHFTNQLDDAPKIGLCEMKEQVILRCNSCETSESIDKHILSSTPSPPPPPTWPSKGELIRLKEILRECNLRIPEQAEHSEKKSSRQGQKSDSKTYKISEKRYSSDEQDCCYKKHSHKKNIINNREPSSQIRNVDTPVHQLNDNNNISCPSVVSVPNLLSACLTLASNALYEKSGNYIYRHQIESMNQLKRSFSSEQTNDGYRNRSDDSSNKMIQRTRDIMVVKPKKKRSGRPRNGGYSLPDGTRGKHYKRPLPGSKVNTATIGPLVKAKSTSMEFSYNDNENHNLSSTEGNIKNSDAIDAISEQTRGSMKLKLIKMNHPCDKDINKNKLSEGGCTSVSSKDAVKIDQSISVYCTGNKISVADKSSLGTNKSEILTAMNQLGPAQEKLKNNEDSFDPAVESSLISFKTYDVNKNATSLSNASDQIEPRPKKARQNISFDKKEISGLLIVPISNKSVTLSQVVNNKNKKDINVSSSQQIQNVGSADQYHTFSSCERKEKSSISREPNVNANVGSNYENKIENITSIQIKPYKENKICQQKEHAVIRQQKEEAFSVGQKRLVKVTEDSSKLTLLNKFQPPGQGKHTHEIDKNERMSILGTSEETSVTNMLNTETSTHIRNSVNASVLNHLGSVEEQEEGLGTLGINFSNFNDACDVITKNATECNDSGVSVDCGTIEDQRDVHTILTVIEEECKLLETFSFSDDSNEGGSKETADKTNRDIDMQTQKRHAEGKVKCKKKKRRTGRPRNGGQKYLCLETKREYGMPKYKRPYPKEAPRAGYHEYPQVSSRPLECEMLPLLLPISDDPRFDDNFHSNPRVSCVRFLDDPRRYGFRFPSDSPMYKGEFTIDPQTKVNLSSING